MENIDKTKRTVNEIKVPLSRMYIDIRKNSDVYALQQYIMIIAFTPT